MVRPAEDGKLPNTARLDSTPPGPFRVKRNIRFIKADPNGQDMDPPNITQAIKGENDCRPKVQGSNPTDGQMTRSRISKIVAKRLKAKDIIEPSEGIEDTIANDLKGV